MTMIGHAHFPYLIVGGGPAGATAAERLARAKRKVLLIEKFTHNPFRDKPCGGGLSPAAVKLFPYIAAVKAHETRTLKLSVGADSVSTEFPVVMVNRSGLDYLLLERAIRCKAKVQYDRTVTTVDLPNRIVTLNSDIKITYDHIIGAAGVACPVAGAFGIKTQTVPAIVGRVDGGKLNKSDTAEIRLFDDLDGYAWIFPKGTFLDVGIVGKAKTEALAWGLSELIDENNLKIENTIKWVLPDEPPWGSMIASEDTIICGDAAGFINPLTREGIRYAMQSGLEAAEVLLGVRDMGDYPSFSAVLRRLSEARKKVTAQGLKKSFDDLKRSPELLQNTMRFFSEGEEAPKWKPIQEEEKLKLYNKIEQAIPGSEEE